MRDFLAKLFIAAVTLVVVLGPVWFYLSVRLLMSPVGFWQNFVLLGAGLYFLGFVQLILIVLWVAFILAVIFD